MKPSLLLAIQPQQWRLCRVTDAAFESRDIPCDGHEAAAVQAALAQWGSSGAPLCLGLPSSMVLSAEIDYGDLPRKDRSTAMLYRLEEQLPVDVETLVVDFLPPAGGKALGVAVAAAPVEELLRRLAEAGVVPEALCPTALLALWSAAQSAEPFEYALVAMDGVADVFSMRQKQPCAWSTVADDPQEIVRCVRAQLLREASPSPASRCRVIAPPEWRCEPLENSTQLQMQREGQSPPHELAARAAAQLLAGSRAGWVNLRKGALGPKGAFGTLGKRLQWTVAMAMLLPLALSLAMLWRGVQYSAQADEALDQQVETYQKVYPNARAPKLIRSRLQSDLSRSRGLSGASESLPRQAEALRTLRQVVAALPMELRWQLLDLRIASDGVRLEGRARLHSDAEKITRNLSAAGFEMDPPKTESLPGEGVSFSISGNLPAGTTAPSSPAAQPNDTDPLSGEGAVP